MNYPWNVQKSWKTRQPFFYNHEFVQYAWISSHETPKLQWIFDKAESIAWGKVGRIYILAIEV